MQDYVHRQHKVGIWADPAAGTQIHVVYAPPYNIHDIGRFGDEAAAKKFIDARASTRYEWKRVSIEPEIDAYFDLLNDRVLGHIEEVETTPNGFLFDSYVGNKRVAQKQRRMDAKKGVVDQVPLP
jgi:hypothetical protein